MQRHWSVNSRQAQVGSNEPEPLSPRIHHAWAPEPTVGWRTQEPIATSYIRTTRTHSCICCAPPPQGRNAHILVWQAVLQKPVPPWRARPPCAVHMSSARGAKISMRRQWAAPCQAGPGQSTVCAGRALHGPSAANPRTGPTTAPKPGASHRRIAPYAGMHIDGRCAGRATPHVHPAIGPDATRMHTAQAAKGSGRYDSATREPVTQQLAAASTHSLS